MTSTKPLFVPIFYRLALAVAALAVLLLSAACSGRESLPTPTPTRTPQPPVTPTDAVVAIAAQTADAAATQTAAVTPTFTAAPTDTPTATPEPATATPEPSATPEPPTATPAPVVVLLPTATPRPVVPTAVPQPTATPAPAAQDAAECAAIGGDGCKFKLRGGPAFTANGGGELRLTLGFVHSGRGNEAQGSYFVWLEKDGVGKLAVPDNVRSWTGATRSGPNGVYNYEYKIGLNDLGGSVAGCYTGWVLDGNGQRDSLNFRFCAPDGQGEVWMLFDQA